MLSSESSHTSFPGAEDEAPLPPGAASVLSAQTFAGLPMARYECSLRAVTEAELPNFPGSTLRGTFGHALKRAVCVMSHRACERCLVASRCLYPYVFETPWPAQAARMAGQQNAPHPFVLSAPLFPRGQRTTAQPRAQAEEQSNASTADTSQTARDSPPAQRCHTLAPGEKVVFGLSLLGRAIEHLPYLVFAIHELAELGLSVRRHKFVLEEVVWLTPTGARQTLYAEATGRLETPPGAPPTLADYVSTRLPTLATLKSESALNEPPPLRLRFLTPTRLKTGGQLQWRADFQLLARSLLRRISQLQLAHGAAPLALNYGALLERARQVTVWGEAVRWWDWGRYSNRQQTGMKLGGFVGPLGLRGAALTEFLPLLVAGELLGVGSGTSFGLGQYRIEQVFPKTDRGLPTF